MTAAWRNRVDDETVSNKIPRLGHKWLISCVHMFLRKLFILAKRLFVGRSLKETISFFCIFKQTNFLLIPKIISSRSFLVLFQKRGNCSIFKIFKCLHDAVSKMCQLEFNFTNFPFSKCAGKKCAVFVWTGGLSVTFFTVFKMCRHRVNAVLIITVPSILASFLRQTLITNMEDTTNKAITENYKKTK